MFSARFPFTQPFLSAAVALLVLLCLPVPLTAQTGKSLTSFDNICLAEARRAEVTHGIPTGLMQSITRVESGRKMVTGEYMPWAWTLNDRGEGLFFDSREAALAYLRDAVATPGHSVDVGCMQVNTKWHADGFPDIADMLDPVHNASYAAGFLLDLHAAHQSWDEAVKHYHSAEPRKNVAYHRRVLAELERFMADAGPVADAPDNDAPDNDAPDNDVVDMAANGQANGATMPAQELGSAEMVLMTGPSVTKPAPNMGPNMAPAPSPASAPTSVPAMPPSSQGAVAAHRHLATPVVTPPVDRPALSGASQPTPPSSDATDDSLLAKQPNLAPHRSRVEHFRRLLARQAG
jgi:hypothetical protein